MMSPETIREMNREAAERAAKQGKRPMEVTDYDWADYARSIEQGSVPRIMWPALAPEYVEELYPHEYEVVETFFVDKTGLDPYDAGGPALSIYQLMRRGQELSQLHGTLYATIHDEGQFQIYASLFVAVGRGQECLPWQI